MSFLGFETSIFSGKPVELYLFDRDGQQQWAYTSASTVQTYDGLTYNPIAIQRNDLKCGGTIENNTLNVSAPVTVSFVQQYINRSPTDRISFTLRRFHSGDEEVLTLWTGRVVNVKFGESVADIRCETLHSSFRRPILRRLYQTQCPHLLYGPICTLNKTNFVEAMTITAIDGVTITATEFGGESDGYWSGGWIEFQINGVYNRAFITDHSGTQVTVSSPLIDAEVGSNINVYPGCAHNLLDCLNKFNNVANYGGQPWIPDKNPFDYVFFTTF